MTEEPPPHAGPAEEAPFTLDEIVDRAGRRIATALVVAGALIGLAIYWQPPPPRYQMIASGSQVLRIDTRRGSIIACEDGQCGIVVRRGQHLSSRPPASLPKPAAPALVPAPTATPAAPAAR